MKFDPRPLLEKLDSTADVKQLLKIIKGLNDESRKVILEAIGTELTQNKKTQVMNMIRSSVATADAGIRDWLIKGISASYVAGMNQTVKNLKSIPFKMPPNTPPLKPMTVELLHTVPEMKPHLEAVNTLLSDAYLDFGGTMSSFVKGAERIVNDALRRQVQSTIAQGRLEGSSVNEIAKTVTSAFQKQGFTVLVDRGGNKWSLEQYSQMLTRTQLLSANNEGVVNRAGDFQIDIVEISSHGADDAICAEQEGKIYSISGNSDEYPALGDNEPPFHPNCRHTLLMRPDLK